MRRLARLLRHHDAVIEQYALERQASCIALLDLIIELATPAGHVDAVRRRIEHGV